MKNIYLIIPFIYLLAAGCSTTYTINDFPSHEGFYEDLNESAKEKNVTIITKDTTILSDIGFEINNDSLILINNKIMKEEKIISLNEIKNLEYQDNTARSPVILELQNGEKLEVENIQRSRDSIKFNNIKFFTLKNSIPFTEIKTISYKGRLRGLITGFLTGTLYGAVIGGFTHIIPVSESHPSRTPPYQTREYDSFSAFVIGTASGALLGSIIGWIIGFNYNYQFN